MFKEMVSVKREALVACMTCPICNHIFKDATTISECLHTFCRKCICKKFADEELERCPVCDIDLGVVPEEKLRPDHNLEDLRAKIFPYKRRKLDPSEDVSSIALPSRRKEKSLSSLVVNTPRVSSKTALTGRRSKAPVRKPLRGSSFSVEKQIKKDENFASFMSRETPSKQNSSNGEPSSHSTLDIGTENGASTGDGKVNVWKPLNFLVEAANRNKSAKFTSQGSTSNSQPTNAAKAKQLAFRNKRKIKDENYSTGIQLSESRKPKRIQWLHQKKESTFGNTNLSPQEVLDACDIRHEKRLNPVWCSLVASKDLEDYRSLPQISASFLRIKDGSISVSFIQKYLMRKLNLPGEDEIEIRCRGEPVVPTLQLHKLIELWLQKISSSEKVSAKIGSSAKEFVMVLGYARKPSSA